MKRIKKFIYNIVVDATQEIEIRQRENLLNHTADLARLIIDCKNNNLSLQSRAFICRMNIHPDTFNK